MAGMTYVVDRAYNDYSWYHQLTQEGSTFVGRIKKNALYEVTELRNNQHGDILSDEVISLTSDKAKKDCPIPLRRITFRRPDDQKILVFISNDMTRSAVEIADLYKQRWQIELFFKWIKQNLKIKKFIGRSENAVLIQVLVGMIAYLLIKLIQLESKTARSLQQIARLLSLNLMASRSLLDLLHLAPDKRRSAKMEGLQLEIEVCFS